MTVMAVFLSIYSSSLVFPRGKFYRTPVPWSFIDNTVEQVWKEMNYCPLGLFTDKLLKVVSMLSYVRS